MMRNRAAMRNLAGAALLALSHPVWAQPAPCKTVMTDKFDTLVALLDDDDYHVRECSQDELHRRLVGKLLPVGDYRKLITLSLNAMTPPEVRARAGALTASTVLKLDKDGDGIFRAVRVHELLANRYRVGATYDGTFTKQAVFDAFYAKLIAVETEILLADAVGARMALVDLGKYVKGLSKADFATLGLTYNNGKPATQQMFADTVAQANINIRLPGFESELRALKEKGAGGLPVPINVPPESPLRPRATVVDLGLSYSLSLTEIVTPGGLYPFLFRPVYNPAAIPAGYRYLHGDGGVYRLAAEGGLEVSGPITIGFVIGKKIDPSTVSLLRVANGVVTILPTDFNPATNAVSATYDPGADADQFGIFVRVTSAQK
jgi:hypothetical protein